jgi:amino acid transporter
MFVTTNISYALGPGAAWIPHQPWCVALISAVLVLGLAWTAVRGLSLGKWLHNVGAFAMFLAYGALIILPFIGLARGELKEYHPLQLAAPTVSLFFCLNIFTKLAVGALRGFEYVAILAGEARAPQEALVGVGASEAVARGALDVLVTGRALVLEVAAGDAGRIAAALEELGYSDVSTAKDLAGRDRVVEGVRP